MVWNNVQVFKHNAVFTYNTFQSATPHPACTINFPVIDVHTGPGSKFVNSNTFF